MQITDGLDAEGILNDFVRIGGESRTSTAVVDPTSGLQTEINEYGPEVTADELEALVDSVRYLAGAVSTVVFAGSLPRRVETSFYADVIARDEPAQGRTVIDTDGEPLRLALAAEPTLVFAQPARGGGAGRQRVPDRRGLPARAARRSRRWARADVVITLKTGCYALLAAGKAKARMFRAWIPRIEAVSAVGSGDAFLAGFLSAQQAGAGG